MAWQTTLVVFLNLILSYFDKFVENVCGEAKEWNVNDELAVDE